jgi:hypothetical protein
VGLHFLASARDPTTLSKVKKGSLAQFWKSFDCYFIDNIILKMFTIFNAFQVMRNSISINRFLKNLTPWRGGNRTHDLLVNGNLQFRKTARQVYEYLSLLRTLKAEANLTITSDNACAVKHNTTNSIGTYIVHF